MCFCVRLVGQIRSHRLFRLHVLLRSQCLQWILRGNPFEYIRSLITITLLIFLLACYVTHVFYVYKCYLKTIIMFVRDRLVKEHTNDVYYNVPLYVIEAFLSC